MKKLIERYKARIDKHNENLDGTNCENAWDYTTILNPILFAIITMFIILLFSIAGNKSFEYIIKSSIFSFIGSLICYSIVYAINWFIYDKKE